MARITTPSLTALPNGLNPARTARESVLFSQPINTQTSGNYDQSGFQPVFTGNVAGFTPAPLPTAEDIIIFGIAEAIGTPSAAIHSLHAGDQISLSGPVQAAFDGAGNAYLLNYISSTSYITGVFKLDALRNISLVAGTTSGSARVDGTGTGAQFLQPTSICYAGDGNLYVTETSNTIRRIVPSTGVVTTFAGSGTAGSTDGTGTAATFNAPNAICYNAFDGNLYVADVTGNRIRRVTLAGVVTTFAGDGRPLSADGTGTAASFYAPSGITCDPVSGNLWVTDRSGHLIRRITQAGVVTTIAGTGTAGVNDSTSGTSAAFYAPTSIAYNTFDQNLYVRQQGATTPIGLTFRRISTAGTFPTSTIAGLSTSTGNQEGGGFGTPCTQYSAVGHVSIDPLTGAAIFAEASVYRFKRLTMDGRITAWAGFSLSTVQANFVTVPTQFPAVAMYKIGEVMRTYASSVGQEIWIPLPHPVRVAAGTKVWAGSRNNSTTVTNHTLYVAYAAASIFG
jgi:sugar lactone lactonase YvrE